MKTIILCGGMGTRMKEETEFKPKPMVLVGGRPILWHIMKIYAHYGHNEFVLALGYKGDMIKNYFLRQHIIDNDFTLRQDTKKIDFHGDNSDNFHITFAETGLESLTGKRILRIKKHITDDEFMVTYGDGVSAIDINALISFHRRQGTIGTISGVHLRSKFGMIRLDKKSGIADDFEQKPYMSDYVNGGFMVFNKRIFDYLDESPIENVFPRLIQERQLSVYTHDSFWTAVDTYQELQELNESWNKDRPWAVWENGK